jgi:hypothetical protein
VQGYHRDSEVLVVLWRHEFTNSCGAQRWRILQHYAHVGRDLTLAVLEAAILALDRRAKHRVDLRLARPLRALVLQPTNS